jgi:hypothetical protein
MIFPALDLINRDTSSSEANTRVLKVQQRATSEQQLFLGEIGWSALRGASISDLRGLGVLMTFR